MKTLNNTAETQTGLEAPKALTRVAREALAAEIVNVPRETRRAYAESDIDVDHFINEEDPNDIKIKQLNEEIRHLNTIKKKAEREEREKKEAERQTRESIGTVAEGAALSALGVIFIESFKGAAAFAAKATAAIVSKFVTPPLFLGVFGYFSGRLLRSYRNFTGSETVTFLWRSFAYGTSGIGALGTVFMLIDAGLSFGTVAALLTALAPAIGAAAFAGGFALGDLSPTGTVAARVGNQIPKEVIDKASHGFHWRFIDIARKDGYSY